MSDLEEVLADLSAFADEESDAAVDSDGTFLIQRGGVEIGGQISHGANDTMQVTIDGDTIPYGRFLTHNLARLDVLAQRLLERRAGTQGFVDSQVRLQKAAEDVTEGNALTVLSGECENRSPFSSRVLFITADAGHGKTALLREHQYQQARRFAEGSAQYLFWHLDLQGRQLLRLSEALMGDLADLRLAGLWMPAVIRLMRRGALIVGVDGFDELAAEQGGADALGALASLVSQLKGTGTVVAASRRTFFDTDDYLRRGGMVRRGVPDPCQFDQMELSPWKEADVKQYLSTANFNGLTIKNPEEMYAETLTALGGDKGHPIITRPFLVTQIARASALFDAAPGEFLTAPEDPYSGVASVVSAFVEREVAEKWKVRETGEPYLSKDRHLQFLSDVAEEMHRSQRDRLSIDIVETIATLLLDQWDVESGLRQQIIEMVRMHVLLIAPPGDSMHRSFDHPEFRDYFVAYALRSRIDASMKGHPAHDLVRFLSISQLSDSTARYVCTMVDRDASSVAIFLRSIESVLEREWKPTYLQQNLGTLIPFMIDGITFDPPEMFSGKVIYSSLALEQTAFDGLTLRNGTFLNASLRGAHWKNVTLEKMNLGELQLDREADFVNTRIVDCSIDGVRIQMEDEEELREYAPGRIRAALSTAGFEFVDEELPLDDDTSGLEDSGNIRLLRKLLRLFNRTTIVSDDHLKKRFGSDFPDLESTLIPTLVEEGILQAKKWKGSGTHSAWTLAVGMDDFLASEGSRGPYSHVWRRLRDGV